MKRWSEEEIYFLKTNYGGKTTRQLAKDLGRSFESVKNKVSSLMLGQKTFSEQTIQRIIEVCDDFSYEELSDMFGATPRFIQKLLNSRGISKDRIKWGELELPDPLLKAYVAGVIATDGHIQSNPNVRVAIYLQKKDEAYIRGLAKILVGTDACVMGIGRRGQVGFTLTLTNLIRYLNSLGIPIGDKTTTLSINFDMLNGVERLYFLRGVVDGDGSLDKDVYRLRITTASEKFATQLQDVYGFKIRKRNNGDYWDVGLWGDKVQLREFLHKLPITEYTMPRKNEVIKDMRETEFKLLDRKVIGVTKERTRWVAVYKQKTIGRFSTKVDAQKCYDDYVKKIPGYKGKYNFE